MEYMQVNRANGRAADELRRQLAAALPHLSLIHI